VRCIQPVFLFFSTPTPFHVPMHAPFSFTAVYITIFLLFPLYPFAWFSVSTSAFAEHDSLVLSTLVITRPSTPFLRLCAVHIVLSCSTHTLERSQTPFLCSCAVQTSSFLYYPRPWLFPCLFRSPCVVHAVLVFFFLLSPSRALNLFLRLPNFSFPAVKVIEDRFSSLPIFSPCFPQLFMPWRVAPFNIHALRGVQEEFYIHCRRL
jgi:hypothetical protein